MSDAAASTGIDHGAHGAGAAIGMIALFVLVAALAWRGVHPPAPLAADAAPDVFSSARAMPVLQRILGDESPHPTGSAANAAVRDRIVAELERLGLQPQVQRRFACGGATCAVVDNVVARLPGASREQAVLLSAHYDSVAAGPGASDDGAGVAAIVEVARALQAGPPLARDVWLLANDGEELGLIGAEAFAREPEFADIASVVNVEARGTTGPSMLIETQPGNAAVVDLARSALARVAGSSLDYEIYKTLPNDTDFTVYRREGLAGTNFAWASGAARYHTPLDDLAHVDPGSLQHHGDNVLAMARALASAEAATAAAHDAVFFGVFGTRMLSWPVTWNPYLLGAGLLAWLALAIRLVRAHATRPLRVAGAAAGWLVALAVLGISAWLVHWVLQRLGATPAAWTAQGDVLGITFLALAVAVLVPQAGLLRRWCGGTALAVAGLLPSALIAAAAAVAMPGAIHLGLLPLLAGAVAGHIWPRRPALWSGLAAVVAAVLLVPYAADGYSAIGAPGLPAVTVIAGLTLLPLLPALVSLPRTANVAAWLSLLVASGCALAALGREPFDAHTPRPVNLTLTSNGEQARLFVQPRAALPPGFLREAGFETSSEPVFPWYGHGFSGPSGAAVTPPSVEVVADSNTNGRRHLRLRVESRRGAVETGLVIPGSVDITSVRVDGEPLAQSRWHAQHAEWRRVAAVGVTGGAVAFDLHVDPTRPLTVHAYDMSRGIAPAYGAAIQARDVVGMPIGAGDSTWAWRTLELEGR